MYYFSIFLPVAEGGYAILFPDFPEVASEGDTPEECMEMATDALSIVVEEYARSRKALPAPSPLEKVQAIAAVEMESEGIDASRVPLFQLFAAPSVDLTPVKISLSIAKSVLESIDAKAARSGMTRSGFMAAAAKAYEAPRSGASC